jgi:hypothetical protein
VILKCVGGQFSAVIKPSASVENPPLMLADLREDSQRGQLFTSDQMFQMVSGVADVITVYVSCMASGFG